MSTVPETGIASVRVDRVLIEEMMAHIVRRERVFRLAVQALEPRHFNQLGETVYRVVFGVLVEFYAQYGRLPPREILATETLSRIGADLSAPEGTLENAAEFIEWIWTSHPTDEDFQDEAASHYVRLFLIDREVHQELSNAIRGAEAGGGIPDLDGLLSTLNERHRQIQTLGQSASHLLVPTTWETTQRPRMPTGLPLFDTRMNGGNEAGDVNVLLGPTGVGKTMVGMQLYNSCMRQDHLAVMEGGQGHINVFISYEDDLRSMRIRSICNAAQISKTKLENITSLDELSRTGQLEPYEGRRFAHIVAAGGTIPGESERLEAASEWMNRYGRLLDFSGSREFGPSAGDGGVAEIRGAIERIREDTGLPIGMVVLDWAGSACTRWLHKQGKDVERVLSIELRDYVNRVHQEVTAPFGCRATVVHQLNGAANRKPPIAPQHHSEADWCASFAVHAWFAFVLGTKDMHTNTCMLNCTKTRRGQGVPPVVCYIDGDFGQLVQADDDYRTDPTSRRIIPRDQAEAVVAPPPPQQRMHAGIRGRRSAVDADRGLDSMGTDQ